MIIKNSELKRERCIILLNVFPMYFFGQKIILICVLTI
jgi:hypothetical protein